MAGRNWKYRAKLRAGWEMGRVRNVPGLSGQRAPGGLGGRVQMPTAPGWQAPLREFTKSPVPTLSEATCRAIGADLDNLNQQGSILRIAGG